MSAQYINLEQRARESFGKLFQIQEETATEPISLEPQQRQIRIQLSKEPVKRQRRGWLYRETRRSR